MNVRTRAIAAGALALFTTAAMATLAGPAQAASGIDLTVTAESSKIAIGSPIKAFFAKIKNLGDTTAEGLKVEIDLAGLDGSLAEGGIDESIAELCAAPADDKITCVFPGTLAPAENFELPLVVTPVKGAQPGPAGKLFVTVQPGSGEDADDANNKAEIPVELVGSGGDIVVLAQDVVAGYGEQGVVQPVVPGETAAFFWAIFNFGDVAVQGISLTVELPEHVSFVDKFEGCTYRNGDRSVTCDAPDGVLVPNEGFGNGEEGWTVKVAADAPGPVNLAGTARGAAAGVQEGPQTLNRSAATAEWLEPAQEVPAEAEVDEGDNGDDFTVFVGAPAGGSGGGAGDGPGGLAVTGVKVGVIGGVGGAVVAAGALLLFFARRRRVVLVAPGDETPTA
jgi:hypothetical protein